MSDIAKVTDHWTETVSDFILEQYKDASNWKAILKAVIDKCSDLEDQIWKLAPILDFKCRVKGEIPTGALLDFIAGIMNVTRNGGESDRDFYERFVTSLDDDSAGTPDNVIYNAAILSGDTAPQYMDEAPATFIVYDGPVYERHDPETEGEEPYDELVKPAAQRQLLRREVKKLAPCGVLGLPGAAIKLSNGRLLCTSDHKKLILAVANDANSEVDTVLIDNGGNLMVTSQQKVVKVSLKGDARYQTTPIHVDGVPGTIDGIRVKDLPDAQNDDAYVLRDSDVGGTTKAAGVGESAFDNLWDNTPADPAEDEGD